MKETHMGAIHVVYVRLRTTKVTFEPMVDFSCDRQEAMVDLCFLEAVNLEMEGLELAKEEEKVYSSLGKEHYRKKK